MNPKCVSPTACRIGRVIAICVAAFVLLMNGARADETAVRDRYESLKKSVLPDAERRSIRSVVTSVADSRDEQDSALATPRMLVTSTWQLVEAAREAGTLDELLKLVQPLADEEIEHAKPLLHLIQIARGEGAKWEPQFKQFVSERKAEWSKPAEAGASRLRVSADDVLIAKMALADPDLHRSGVALANAIIQHSFAANIGTFLPQVRRDLASSMMSRVPENTYSPTADPELEHWVAGSLIRPDEAQGSAPSAWWLAHEGVVSHVSGTGQDFLFLAIPLTGKFEFSCECWASYWGESNTGYGGLVCDTLHGSQRTLIWPAGGHEQRGTHKPQERWDNWNRIRIAVDTEQRQASWFVNDHLIYTDLDIGPTSPWVSLFTFGVCQTAVRNLRITGEPEVPRVVALSNTNRLEGWVSSFFRETQPPRRDGPNRNPLVNKVLKPRDETANAFDWSSRDGQILGRRVAIGNKPPKTMPSRLYYHRPLRNGETVRYEFYYDRDAKQLVHPTLGRLAMLLEPDGVQLLRMDEPSNDDDDRRMAAPGRPASAQIRTAEGGHPTPTLASAPAARAAGNRRSCRSTRCIRRADVRRRWR